MLALGPVADAAFESFTPLSVRTFHYARATVLEVKGMPAGWRCTAWLREESWPALRIATSAARGRRRFRRQHETLVQEALKALPLQRPKDSGTDLDSVLVSRIRRCAS